MEKLNSLKKWVAEIPKDIEDQIIVFLRQPHTQSIIFNFERNRLFRGQNANKTKISPLYTPFTKRIKRFKGQPTDRVTLKDTGDFYAAMGIIIDRNRKAFLLINRDSKIAKLTRKYGNYILGLTPEDIDFLRSLFFKHFQNFLKGKPL